MESDAETRAQLRPLCQQLPKVELHLHLDGSIPMQFILEQVRAGAVSVGEQVSPANATPQDVMSHLLQLKHAAKAGSRPKQSQNWGVFDWMNEMLQTSGALKRVTELLLEELKEHNVQYAEVRFCPSLHLCQGLQLDEVMDAVLEGFRAGSEQTGVQGGILVCALRSYDKEHSLTMAKLVEKYKGKGVLGFDIAGDERYPLEIHREAIEFCRSQGLPVTVHAGERLAGVDGTLESILANLRLASELDIQRIGHGFAISLDEDVFNMFVEKRGALTVEVCLSAVTPWLTKSGMYKDHPIKRYFESGIPVTLSCDNLRLAGKEPSIGTTPTDELLYLVCECKLEWSQVRDILLQGIRASFSDEQTKQKLIDVYASEIDSLLPQTADQ